MNKEYMNINNQLIEIASWRVVTEICRRYPKNFEIIEMHPGGGLYDCLALYDIAIDQIVAEFNREGRLHISHSYQTRRTPPEPFDIWPNMISNGFLNVLDTICESLGLKIPAHRPASNKRVQVYRFMASSISCLAFEFNSWEWRNGFLDTSGFGAGKREYFDDFDEPKQRIKDIKSKDEWKVSRKYWFLLKNGNPILCVDTSGKAWQKNNHDFDLIDLYKKRKSMIWMVNIVLGEYLP